MINNYISILSYITTNDNNRHIFINEFLTAKQNNISFTTMKGKIDGEYPQNNFRW